MSASKPRKRKATHCSQCGRAWRSPACGLTHAAVQAAGGDPSKVEFGCAPKPKPSRKVVRVKAWLVYDETTNNVWWRDVNKLPMIWSAPKGVHIDNRYCRHIPCTITYTLPIAKEKKG